MAKPFGPDNREPLAVTYRPIEALTPSSRSRLSVTIPTRRKPWEV